MRRSIHVTAVIIALSVGLPGTLPFVAAQGVSPAPDATGTEAGVATLPRAAVQKFVSDFYLAGEDLEPEQIEAVYAPRVQYYGASASRATIVRDQQAYTRRWPERRYTLLDETLTITPKPNAPKTFDVSFDYDFDVRSKDRSSMGRGFARLTLDFSVPGGQIIAVEGRVTQRKR